MSLFADSPSCRLSDGTDLASTSDRGWSAESRSCGRTSSSGCRLSRCSRRRPLGCPAQACLSSFVAPCLRFRRPSYSYRCCCLHHTCSYCGCRCDHRHCLDLSRRYGNRTIRSPYLTDPLRLHHLRSLCYPRPNCRRFHRPDRPRSPLHQSDPLEIVFQ